jgi:hypothetical protein
MVGSVIALFMSVCIFVSKKSQINTVAAVPGNVAVVAVWWVTLSCGRDKAEDEFLYL